MIGFGQENGTAGLRNSFAGAQCITAGQQVAKGAQGMPQPQTLNPKHTGEDSVEARQAIRCGTMTGCRLSGIV